MRGHYGGVRLQHRDAPADDASCPHAQADTRRSVYDGQADHQIIVLQHFPTRGELLNLDYYAPVLTNALRIVAILIFAYIATRAVARLLVALKNYSVKMMLKSGGGSEYELEMRAETMSNLIGKFS